MAALIGCVADQGRGGSLAGLSGPAREEVGALDVFHGFGECRVAEASFHFLGAEVLDAGLDPPQVAQRIADTADAIAEEQVGDLRY
jgi:hypothetical protein